MNSNLDFEFVKFVWQLCIWIQNPLHPPTEVDSLIKDGTNEQEFVSIGHRIKYQPICATHCIFITQTLPVQIRMCDQQGAYDNPLNMSGMSRD